MLFAAAKGRVVLRKHFADYADRGPGGGMRPKAEHDQMLLSNLQVSQG